jgi:hypothetical protein
MLKKLLKGICPGAGVVMEGGLNTWASLRAEWLLMVATDKTMKAFAVRIMLRSGIMLGMLVEAEDRIRVACGAVMHQPLKDSCGRFGG